MARNLCKQNNDNKEISDWFLKDYFVEGSKSYEYSVAFRSFLSRLLAKDEIKKIFTKNDFNFKEIVEEEAILIAYIPNELGEAGAILLELILLSFEFEIDSYIF